MKRHRETETDVVITAPTYPRLKKLWKLPPGCDIKSFVMREVGAKDEMEAAIWAEKSLSSAERTNAMAVVGAQQRECMRLSLVEVDGSPVNHDGIPFKAMDQYSIKTLRFLQYAFNLMNGVDDDDLKNFEAGAEVQ